MLIILIGISAVVLFGYWFVAVNNIYARAEESIRRYMEDREYYLDFSWDYFFVLEFYVNKEPVDYDEGSEYWLSKYYVENKDNLENGRVYHYRDHGYSTVYMPMEDVVWDDDWYGEKEGAVGVLVYCDVTYSISSINRNLLMFSATVAAMLLLLFLVSRNTVRSLNKKDEEMKNFFANASHELKTPLMSIRGNVDGMRDGYVDMDTGCAVIEKEAERMSNLVGEILEISRLDSGALQPEFLEYDVREIIYDAASSVMLKADEKGIKVDVDLPDPIFRLCDEAMLYSAFSNILTNAVRYARSFIGISAKPCMDNDQQVTLRFENDGEPVSEEDMKHIFDRFYTGKKGQTGIGMALAQGYVKVHGSEICVSVRNNNTIFEIVI